MEIRHDWTVEEIEALFSLPFPELAFRAMHAHREHHDPSQVQLATLANIKPGGCAEDCSYCPQSAHFGKSTGMKPLDLLPTEVVLEQARRAKAAGASRFCMGAAWREVRNGPKFDQVLDICRGVDALGMEVCVTLGMVDADQARRLAEAGVHAYNHNLDTSPEFYEEIISTRTYDDRLQTLHHVRDAGMTVCCGGIMGMGESLTDRASLLQVLATMTPHPESVPINKLVRAPGTPLENQEEIDVFDWLKVIAVARIVMPASRIRLAAGRAGLTREAQALAFLLGANSIFYGEKLLTTPNPDVNEDRTLLSLLGMAPAPTTRAEVPAK